MASFSYGSESTTEISNSSNASDWTGAWTFAAINAIAKANIPAYATITAFTFTVYAKEQSGTFNSDIDIFFANSSNSSVKSLYSNDNCVYDSDYSSYALDLKSNVQSGNTSAGQIAYSSADRICVKLEKTTSLGTNRKWQCYYVAKWDYTISTCTATFKNYDGTILQTVPVNKGSTPSYTGSTPTRASTAEYSYTFSGWSPSVGAITANATYTAQFTATKRKYTVNFKNADGSVVETLSNIEYGKTLGTLPTVSRNGYTFVGWIPCEPARKTDDTVLDSCRYTGDSGSFYALHQRYKYTDNLSVHIEAYMSSWEDIEALKAQIISCTEGGGWGLGYQANTTGHGCELYAGGYKGINLGFGTDGAFSDKTWYSFDIVFSNGTFEVYLNGVKKGTQTTSSTTISYNADNTIFVGAEAAKSTTTPGGNYFKGYISNVFIANKGTRLAIATTSTVVEGNVDYYPVWRLNPTYTITTSAENGSVSGGGTYEEGKTATLTAIPNDGYVFKQWSDGNTDNPRTVTVTGDVTYTAEFESAMPEFTLVQMLYNNKQISKDNKVPAGQSFRLIAGVK